ITQFANRSKHDSLAVTSADPLDPHLHLLAAALHVHDDPFYNLANDLFAISIAGAWCGPECRNIDRQAANGLPLRFRKEAWLVLDKAMILLLEVLLGRQFLLPGVLQRARHQPVL